MWQLMDGPFGAKIIDAVRGSNIRFRNKVMLGVGISMVAALLSGLNAMVNVRRVEASVNFSAMSASPLLIGVFSLSESYQKLQGIFDPVVKNCASLEDASRYLEQSQKSQYVKLVELHRFAGKAKASTELARYQFAGDKIFQTRRGLLDVCRASNQTKSSIDSAETSLHSSANLIVVEATMNIVMLEARLRKQHTGMTIVQGEADRAIALDRQTRETWDYLRDFYRLKILVTDLLTVGSLLHNTSSMFELERLRKAYWTKILAIEKNVAGLKRYFDAGSRQKEFEKLTFLTEETKRMSQTAPESLFNSQEQLFNNEMQKQSLVTRLQREQGQFFVALTNIMDVAQRVNRNAQLKTESDANIANWQIAIGVIIGAVLALLIGLFLKRAVTTPLEMLSDNISDVGLAKRGEANAVDADLLKRRDEIGDLANQFARTFAALSKARQELQEESRAAVALQRDRLHGAIENMPQGLYMLDRDGKIIIANRRLYELYNIDQGSELLGMQVADFIVLCRLRSAGIRRTVSEEALPDLTKKGVGYHTSQRVVELDDGRMMTMTVMQLPDGGHVVTHEDITERQTASAQIAHMALHDSLTDLANRTLFRSQIARHAASEGSSETALLFLDLDRFKIVNDTLGHPVGDALLVQVAHRLRTALADNCYAARLGGDEFAILQTGADQPQGAATLAAELIQRISQPFDVDGHHIIIGTSIGIAIAPRDGMDGDELCKNADLALYCAKQDGKGQFSFFEADMDRKVRDWHEMEHDLREAIAAHQFELHYQPLVSLRDDSTVGFEALLRWHHPRRGLVPPAEFIPVAEEAGLIHEIGTWILETACAFATKWPEQISVAVNISPLQLGNGQLPFTVASALSKSGLDAARLVLEITEGVFLNDSDQTVTALNQIRALGVHFAMDDFGTGYSSLSYIRQFPFKKIKIDQSFVRGMLENPESLAIIRAVTNLCQDLGMIATAEGVETPAQAQALKLLGCGLAQGYYFGRPMPAAETFRLFRHDNRLVG
ncbi:EAL domain-containing protein [Rhizobium sp. KVB221]|uniref:EAL domain-containing protein n=1 Tax=Rhizobium setariae TaxID=2801340 RepID=A0A936YUE8_9HYPH|nr:EAL domain-containing protein [Rhizobium setariae]MBL0373122.1 EAL domain-containing protein [Rhizobium setariae]